MHDNWHLAHIYESLLTFTYLCVTQPGSEAGIVFSGVCWVCVSVYPQKNTYYKLMWFGRNVSWLTLEVGGQHLTFLIFNFESYLFSYMLIRKMPIAWKTLLDFDPILHGNHLRWLYKWNKRGHIWPWLLTFRAFFEFLDGGISTRHPVWEASTHHAANDVRASSYCTASLFLSDRGCQISAQHTQQMPRD